MPCLASRLPYGTRVDPEVLAQVDRAERAVRALGYRDLRVRHLGTTARVELAQADLERAATDGARDAIVSAVVRAGYEVAEIAEDRCAPDRSPASCSRSRSPS